MPLIPPVGKEFEMVEPGMHKARCIKVIDLGTQETEYKSIIQHKHKIMIMFELPETEMKEGENAGKPFAINLFVTLSLDKKSTLRPLLVSWRGRDFTEDEAANFDMFKLLNVTALVNVIHNKKDDNTYANIAAIMPLKQSECPERINPLVSFSLSDFDKDVFDMFGDKMKAKIMASPEYKEMINPSMTPEEVESNFGSQDDTEEPFEEQF